jgi:LmbE family N-acetylglucosaminyl deacetylase
MGALLLAFSVAGARPAPAPGPILVVVAHPDDEVLGMAGIIVNGGLRGRSVYVTVVTNGDAHAGSSTSGYCGSANGLPAAYARTGLVRVKETVAAMTVLNVRWAAALPDSNVFFLGYPDAALTSVASSGSPWLGDRTGLHRTYAEDGDGSNVTCNGDFRFLLTGQHSQLSAGALAADLDALITMVDPSDIYTHVGFDSHSDHAEVYRQVIASLERTGLAPAVHTTLIHPEDRSDCLGEWPNPSLA